MKRLLITGSYGLVGSNICKVLEKDHPDIEITKVKCDDFTNVRVPNEKFDYIIHAAGYGQPKLFSIDRIRTIQINTIYTWQLVNLLKKDGKFLFVSSSEIYSGAKSPHKETDIGTTTPQHPRACYIEGKRCGEAICMAYREQGYDVKIARLALAYGPGTKKGDTRVLNELVEKALTTKVIDLIDNGGARRTYIYVEDAAKLMIKILMEGRNDVYNVGGFSTTTILELAKLIAGNTGATVKRGKNKLVGAPKDVQLDMSKTLSEFPYSFIGLDEGITKTIEYQKHLYA